MKKPLLIAAGIVLAAMLFVMTPAGTAVSEGVQSVLVTNFPSPFKVSGTVGVEGFISHAKFFQLREIVVAPVSPKDTVRLVQGGTIPSDGFTAMVLGLQGQIRGDVIRPGTVGIFVLPDDDAIVHAFEEKGTMAFATEISASGVSAASPYFSSSQTRAQIGFPRYRTYFYNTTDKTVTVNFYAYLTN